MVAGNLEECQTAVLGNLAVGLFAVRRDFVITFWNSCLEEWTGIGPDQIVGTRLFKSFPHLQEYQYRVLLEGVLEGGIPTVFSWQAGKAIVPAELCRGRLIAQHTTVLPMPEKSAEQSAALFIVQDASDWNVEAAPRSESAVHHTQTEMAQQLCQYQEQLNRVRTENQQLLEAITAIMIGVDEDWRVIQWNAAAVAAFGVPSADVIGKHVEQCDIKWDWERIRTGILACREQLCRTKIDDIRFTRPDGGEGFLGLTVNPVVMGYKSKKPTGALLLGADITNRRVLEMQLRQAQKLESVGQLAAGIAHEINTPSQYVGDNISFLKDGFEDMLALLRKYYQLLEAAQANAVTPELVAEVTDAIQIADLDYLMEEIPKSIEQSSEGIGHISSIVRAMKEFAHPGIEDKKLTDINKAILNTATVARNVWKYVAELNTELDPLLPLVPCLPQEFNQVILNLLVNAADAIAELGDDRGGQLGTITISTATDGPWAEIRVSDTGAGIPADIQDRIFDAFFTTKEVGKGSGQGLAISQSAIVDKHQGTITCQSQLGHGTTFVVRLPLESSKNGSSKD